MKYIFDFDDVLFNNTKQFKEHMFKSIVDAGVGVSDKEARDYYYLPEVHGREFSLRNFIKALFGRHGVSDQSSRDELYEVIMKKCPEFLNKELIRNIQNKIGIENCYIVTNGETEFNTDKLKYSGVWDLFGEDKIRIVTDTKHEAIKEICDKNREFDVVFVDDKKRFVEEPELKTISNLTVLHYRPETFEKLMREAGTSSSEIKRR